MTRRGTDAGASMGTNHRDITSAELRAICRVLERRVRALDAIRARLAFAEREAAYSALLTLIAAGALFLRSSPIPQWMWAVPVMNYLAAFLVPGATYRRAFIRGAIALVLCAAFVYAIDPGSLS